MQTIVNTSLNLAVTICLLLFIANRSQVQQFFEELLNKVVHLLELCYENPEFETEINVKGHVSRLRRVMWLISVLGLLITVNALYACVSKTIQAGLGTEGMITFIGLTIYWVLVHHYRLLTFCLWIGTIECFEIAFKALEILARSNGKIKSVGKMKQVIWIMEHYKGIEILLKEFNRRFGMQLMSMCIIFFLSMLNGGFEYIKMVRSGNFGTGEVSSLIGELPHTLALNISFFLLCDSSTSLLNQVMGLAVV